MWQARGLSVAVLASLVTQASPSDARDHTLVPPGWSIRHVRVEGRPTPSRSPQMARRQPRADRELTIQRYFETERDLFFGGTINYGNVRLFNPVPSIDSGRQLPYGLDGIGGYGSDYGTSAGQDAAIYDRGP